jgi:microcystin-dependent protein
MPLESAQYISDLNSANPISTDSVAQADDHIRLIKSAIKATFPNITGPVTATQATLNAPIPTGIIVMWSGVTAPSGWAICDGTNGTPDLRNRFIVGAGTTYPLGTSGGSTTSSAGGGHTHTESAAGGHNHTGLTGDTALTVNQLPSHTHTWTGTQTAEDNNFTAGSNWLREGSTVQSSSFTVTTTATGEGATHNHSIGTDGSHSHTINAVGDHTHTATPPYYALAYIMKT